jgi:hypothetical protein
MRPFAYQATFTRDEYEVMRRGVVPQDMDDKWFIFCDGESLFFYRSWSGYGIYRVDLREQDNQWVVARASVTTNTDHYQCDTDEREASRLDTVVRRVLLREAL